MIASLPEDVTSDLASNLKTLVLAMLQQRGGRSFGICSTCRHHDSTGTGGYCRLLEVPLAPADGKKICHEHIEA
ncbi:hypothetical protein ACFQEX_19355 [Roseibium salinum]|uniref:hypothetical protein n=1 Tax=Roseibium salinum TaxID=1604349 RepID=UPI0036175115